jgi:magnesium-transporting ATPase (P-type)
VIQHEDTSSSITVDWSIDKSKQGLLSKSNAEETVNQQQLGLVIQGHSLPHIFSNPELTQLYLQATEKCEGIVICRASPSQKASVVKVIKDNMVSKSDTTLAIGDGSNDVAMIQLAHIGIGIQGLEGSEAASSSDYAICEFKNLRRLLFSHGVNLAFKMTNYISFFMGKSILNASMPFFYSFFDGFTGQTIWIGYYGMLNEIIMTQIPFYVYALWDLPLPMDPNNKTINKNIPYVYKEMREKDVLTIWKYVNRQCFQVLVASLIFFICVIGNA